MSVKIRLQRKGRKKQPYYHIVIADSRSPRDGRYIERIGMYNPLTIPATIELDSEKAFDWLTKGAQPTDTTRAILKVKGVYYKKHLQRGVAKGALTQEAADKLLQEWVDKKEATVETRKAQTADAAEARRRKIFGEAPAKPEPVVEEVVETPKEEEAPAVEAVVEAPKEDAPAENTEEKTTEE